MIEPTLRHVTCAHPGGLHATAYWQWGDPANPSVVLCAHGLTRNARDFDALARRLAVRHRVICPDMPGRGRSDWLPDASLYALPQYVTDAVTLIARLDVPSVAWIGTSMGGLMGMVLAGTPGSPITRLVLNDVGPEVNPAGPMRISQHVGLDPVFPSRMTAEAYARELARNFGSHTEEQWKVLTQHYVAEREGAWRLHYDPKIAVVFKAASIAPPVHLWDSYDRITCPTMVVRGESSDILSAATVQAMTERGPRAQGVVIAGVGHAPGLVIDAQVDAVERFMTPAVRRT